MQIVVEVQNEKVGDKVIWFLNQIKGVKVYEKKREKLDEENIDYWTEEELKDFGKITYGLSSNDFGDENEDYSKW